MIGGIIGQWEPDWGMRTSRSVPCTEQSQNREGNQQPTKAGCNNCCCCARRATTTPTTAAEAADEGLNGALILIVSDKRSYCYMSTG